MKCYEVNYVKILCNVYLYISIISFRRAHFKITLGLCLFILKILKKPRNKHCVYYLTIKFELPSKLKKKKKQSFNTQPIYHLAWNNEKVI